MKCLDLTLATPAENLALDEALLDLGEAREGLAVLRFYEAASPCVVVGFGNQVEREVNLPACRVDGVPVLRRVSGGGAVVLGPGCLAYALVLPISHAAELESVTGTNRFVMAQQQRAVEACLGQEVEIRGHTDLAVAGRKFSGNSQRRRRRCVLFHGTLLYDFDLAAISRWLREPSVRPEYRGDRDHARFVVNLGIPAVRLKEALRACWGAREAWNDELPADLGTLVAQRYGQDEWNFRR